MICYEAVSWGLSRLGENSLGSFPKPSEACGTRCIQAPQGGLKPTQRSEREDSIKIGDSKNIYIYIYVYVFMLCTEEGVNYGVPTGVYMVEA